MRNKLFLLTFLGLVAPQLVLAAWWNPFSWFNNWHFSKGEDKTQVSEERIKDIEDKLNNTATSTNDHPVITITTGTSTTTRTITKEENKPKATTAQKTTDPVQTKTVKTWTLSNGAVIDEDGNIISQPTITYKQNVHVDVANQPANNTTQDISQSTDSLVIGQIPEPDYDQMILPKIKNFSVYTPYIKTTDNLVNVAYLDIDTNGGEPVILKKARIKVSASINNLQFCKAGTYNCLSFNYLNDTAEWTSQEKILPPYQSFVLKFSGMNAIPGTYTVTIKYIEVIGVESNKIKYIDGLPLTFNFEIQ